MSEGTVNSVLARKVGRARGGGAETSPWAQVWHVVVPRAADECLHVEAALLKAVERQTELTGLLETMAETGLILRLQGAGAGVGLAHLDAGCLAALIEAQTLGRVLQAEPAERAGTKTDAAIVAPVIDRFLSAALSEAAERGDPAPPWKGFVIRGRFADKRAAELQLGEGPMQLLHFEIDFAGGAKSGVLSLALRPEAQPAAARSGGSDRAAFSEGLLAAGARLCVVLDRPRVPIGWVRELKVGDELSIPRARLSEARVETTQGRLLTRARLGQAAGRRAVRLSLGKEARASGGSVSAPEMQALAPEAKPARSADSAGLSAAATHLPELPDLPGADAGPSDLPDLPDLPEGPQDAPDFPDLPDLPDLPPAG